MISRLLLLHVLNILSVYDVRYYIAYQLVGKLVNGLLTGDYPQVERERGKAWQAMRVGTNPVRKTSFTAESIAHYKNSKGNPP